MLSRSQRLSVILGALIVLVCIRVLLPVILRHAINNRLARVEGYTGHVGGVSLQFFRGAYQLESVEISKREAGRLEPLLEVEEIDFSLAWRELIHGRVVSDIVLTAPRLRITTSTAPTDAHEDGHKWQDAISDIFPIEITRLEISRAYLRFIDETSTPQVDLVFHDLYAVATGLRNKPDVENNLSPARLYAEALTMGEGRLSLSAEGDVLATPPRFTVKLDLKEVPLTSLNDFLEAYANVDVSSGTLQLYAEVTAAEGAFEGYVKPFFENLSFKNITDRQQGVIRRLWEKIVSGVTSAVKNDERQQVATRIPFFGRFGKTDVGIWATIVNLVRNGFVRALDEGRESDTLPPKSGNDLSR